MRAYLAYQEEIRGIRDVQETVKVAEKVAAADIHFLRERVAALDAYVAHLTAVLGRLSAFAPPENQLLFAKGKNQKKALLVLSGNRGLVGGLWHALIDNTLERASAYQHIVVVGAKGEEYLAEESIRPLQSFTTISESPRQEEIERVTAFIFDGFAAGTFGAVDVLYPRFVSLAFHTPVLTQWLPFPFIPAPQRDNAAAGKPAEIGLPIFEPSAKAVFAALLQKYIGVFFYTLVMQTKLSELSSRTVEMERAAERTKKRERELVLRFQKERRQFITQKQLESFVSHVAS